MTRPSPAVRSKTACARRCSVRNSACTPASNERHGDRHRSPRPLAAFDTRLSLDQFVTIAEGGLGCRSDGGSGRGVSRARAWHEAGLPPSIAVNVSASEFRSKGFVDGVAIVLRETRFGPIWVK